MSKIQYSGKLEIIIDKSTLETMLVPFSFASKHVLTSDKVKNEAMNNLAQCYVYYGVSSIEYDYKFL